MSDLVKQAQAGDRAAFEQLYREHVGRVYALCLRMSADAGRAEELTQDVFVRAWRKLRSFRGEAAFSSWLHRLAVNVVYGAQRSAKRRRLLRGEALGSLDGQSGAPAARIDLERAIRALPAGARSIFILHDIEGYGHREIAAMIGVAEGTSKAQLHRARKLLREALER